MVTRPSLLISAFGLIFFQFVITIIKSLLIFAGQIEEEGEIVGGSVCGQAP